ncbi:MAG: dehydrogenase [Myxococcaceae bacterium]|nr:dehydrogenase [Myxococcaceae bacterium]
MHEQSRPKRFRVGVIGAGQIATECHLPALAVSEDVEIAWVADRDLRRAQSVAKSFRLTAVEYRDSIESLPAADAVLLAVPYGVRAPMYPAIASKFGAVYVEKPFALTLEQHEQQCAGFAPERIACGYQRRSSGPVRALRQIIAAKLFGALKAVHMGFGGPGVKTGGRYSSSLAMAGGGILFEVGVHGLDMVLHVTDAVSSAPLSVKMIKTEGIDIHTSATLDVKTADGQSFPFDLVVTGLEYTSNTHEFVFEHASITFGLFGEQAIVVQPRDGSKPFKMHSELMDYPRTSSQLFHEHWRCFFDAMRSGAANVTSASSSRVTTGAIEQLYAEGART